MFSLLTFSSFSLDKIWVKTPTDTNAAFNIGYDDGTSQEGTNVFGSGVYVAFRYYDIFDRRINKNYLLTSQTDSIDVDGHFTIRYKPQAYDRNSKSISIGFEVENTYSWKQMYDLGVFADVNFQNNDNAMISKTMNNTAIKIQGTDDQTFMAILKGAQYPDVTNIYMGALDTSSIIPENYPYWENSTKDTASDEDSVIAFSWIGRELNAREVETLGFIAVGTDTFQRRPIIKDMNKKTTNLQDPTELQFKIIYYDEAEIRLKVTVNGYSQYSDASAQFGGENGNEHILKHTVNFNGKPSLEYSVYAYIVSSGLKSYETITKTIFQEGYEKPEISYMSKEPKDSYFPGDSIRVKGSVDDEKAVSIYYRFDNLPEQNATYVITTSWDRYFEFEKPIPPTLRFAQFHTLTIWAVDNLGQKSEEKNWTFYIEVPSQPVILKAFLSDTKAVPSQTIYIIGQGTDPDNQPVKVNVYWDDPEDPYPKYLATYEPKDNSSVLFSGIYKIPYTYTYGRHHIYLGAIDADGHPSAKYKLGITIVNSMDPPKPARIAKIVDKTADNDKVDEDACFSLHYVDELNRVDQALSHEDKGFYVAYRLYDAEHQTTPRKDIHYLKKSTQEDETDGLHIRYYHDEDPISGYFQAKFDVTNNAYYDQTFDLSIFVDSDFGSANQTIEERDDGRGFVVSDAEANVFYTLFTSYRNLPPVTYQDINTSMKYKFFHSLEYMPFFSRSDSPMYIGDDPMYELGWKDTIRSGKTVTYVLTFAGYDLLRTPSTVVAEITPHKDFYEKNEEVHLKFIVSDDNIGERVNYILNLNGVEETGNFTVAKGAFVLNKTITVGDGPFYSYNLSVYDDVVQLPTDFTGRLIVSQPPKVFFNMDKIKYESFPSEQLEINGWVSDEDENITIMYQFDHNLREEVGKTIITNGNSQQKEFKFNITIPSHVKPRSTEYNFMLWAVDKYGVKSSVSTKGILVTLRDPPVLSKAGLSDKFCKAGDRLIGFVLVNDTQINRYIYAYAKLGNGEYKEVTRFMNTLGYIKNPLPFYYDIPSSMASGVYTVSFLAKDDTGLYSEPIVKTLVVN